MDTVSKVLKTDSWRSANSVSSSERILCQPECGICGGIGYVRYDVPIGDPRFGKLQPCPNLPAQSSIYEGHGLNASEIAQMNWSDFKPRENIGEAITALKNILQRGTGMGYLYGGAGLAKTKLLMTLCALWAREGKGIFHFTTQKAILDDMRLAYDDDEPNRAIKGKQDKYCGYSLLCIDEMTAERNTDFKIEQVFDLVNRRHEAGTERAEGVVTVMAGNINPNDLDFRITDRLTDGRNFIVRLKGDSYRPAQMWDDEKTKNGG